MPKQRSIKKATTTISTLSHEGRGIGHIEGKTTFIFNALVDETVEITYKHRKSQYDEADATTIITPSPLRAKPICQHYTVCGGCQLQHMPHQQQLKLKRNSLKEHLTSQQALDEQTTWLDPLTAATSAYRRKARLGVKYVAAKGKVLVGFRERNGRYVANLLSCPVLDKRVGQKIEALSAWIEQLSIKSNIPQLEVALGDSDAALIIRHLEPFSDNDYQLIKDFAKEHGFLIYLQPGGMDSITAFYPKPMPELSYAIDHSQLTFYFKPQQFTQVNAEINVSMTKRALELLDLKPTDSALDLFCGIGNFSLCMAKHCGELTGVEGDNSAIHQATLNAKHNKIDNCQFLYANLFENVYNEAWSQRRYDKILLDPPRAGAKEIIEQFAVWQPQRVVYVSCNPATLARDAALLKQQGYRLDTIGIMDMFPHTGHVETIALFKAI